MGILVRLQMRRVGRVLSRWEGCDPYTITDKPVSHPMTKNYKRSFVVIDSTSTIRKIDQERNNVFHYGYLEFNLSFSNHLSK